MKKKAIILSIIFFVAATTFLVVLILSKDDEKIPVGRYTAQNCAEYPDAYIEVTKDGFQFFNIDLNAIYQQQFLENYEKGVRYFTNKANETGDDTDLVNFIYTEDELAYFMDFNLHYKDRFYLYDIKKYPPIKTGTATYQYTFFVPGTTHNICVIMINDRSAKTLQIQTTSFKCVFKKT